MKGLNDHCLDRGFLQVNRRAKSKIPHRFDFKMQFSSESRKSVYFEILLLRQ